MGQAIKPRKHQNEKKSADNESIAVNNSSKQKCLDTNVLDVDPPTTNATNVVTFSMSSSREIKTSAPYVFDPAFASDQWGPKSDRVDNMMAANIIYACMIREDAPANVQSHLNVQLSRVNDGSDPKRKSMIRTYLLAIASQFRADVISTMDPGIGLISQDQVFDWLMRTIPVPDNPHDLPAISEFTDCYRLEDSEDLETLLFSDCGAICTRVNAAPTYNIRQQIWLRRNMAMDWRASSLAKRSLAANVIDHFANASSTTHPVNEVIGDSVGDFYASFSEDFVESMPDGGGQIPVSVIDQWFTRQI